MTAEVTEKHFSPDEVAEMWGISRQTVVRMFECYPGVLKFGMPRIQSKRKTKTTIRIPLSVLERFHQDRSSGFVQSKVQRRRG